MIRSVLIIGGSGFLGTQLALAFRDRYKVFATSHKHFVKIPGVTNLPANVMDRDWMKRIIYTALPETIIYAAGRNDPYWAYANTAPSEMAHIGGLGNVASNADRIQARLIYLSNGYVFDGNKGNYHETDLVLPHLSFGKMKLAGENFVKTRSMNHTIVRSAPILGRGNGYNYSFMDEMRIVLSRGGELKLNPWERHGFTSITHFLEVMEAVVNSTVRNKTLHVGGITSLSYFELGQRFAERFGFDPRKVIAGPYRAEYSQRKKPGAKARDPGTEALYDTSAKPVSTDYSLNCTETMKLIPSRIRAIDDVLDDLDRSLRLRDLLKAA